MKVRARRARPALPIRFIEVEQPAMVIAETVDRACDVSGAYVKAQPTIHASERAGLNASAIRKHYLEAGAVAVVIAPIVLPDARSKSLVTERGKWVSAEERIKRFFQNVQASRKVIDAAIAEAIASTNEAGI